MKTYYTMFELIKMMEEGTAPRFVYYNGGQYVNEDNHTYSITNDVAMNFFHYKARLFDEILYNIHDVRDLVTEKLIYSKKDILTDEEIAFLKSYIALADPSGLIDGFMKTKSAIRLNCVIISPLSCGESMVGSDLESFQISEGLFKGMREDFLYSLDDLGLTEEDQDVEICEPEE